MHLTETTIQVITIVGLSALIATVLSYCKVPTIVGFIISGLVIGPYGLGAVKNFPGIEVINEIGLSLLMFTVGLEFAYIKIRYLSKSLIGLGLGLIGSVICLVTVVAPWLGLGSWQHCMMMGMVLSLSSSAIVLKLLQQQRELETPHGNSSMGVLLAQDVVFAPMIMLIPFLFGDGSAVSSEPSLKDFSTLSIFLVSCLSLFLFTKFGLGRLFNFILKTRNQELFFFVLIFLFAVIAFGTEALIGSLSLGAFIAGLCFANSPLAKQALSDILPLRDTFLALLFTSVGMLVNISYFVAHFHLLLLATILLLIMKPMILYILGRMLRYSHAVCLTVGLLTFQIGEFSIVLIKELERRGHFSSDSMQFFLSLTVLTMAITPFLQKLIPYFIERTRFMENWQFPHLSTLSQNSSEQQGDNNLFDHTIIVGYGVAGRQLGKVLSTLDISYVALELNYSTVMRAQKDKLPVIFGDAQRGEILHIAGIDSARCVVITIPAIEITANIITAARKIRSHIPVIVRVEYERAINTLKDFKAVECVVSEHESTLQVLAKTLHSYAIDQKTIISHLISIKKIWLDQNKSLPSYLPDILPYLGSESVKNITIHPGSYAEGRTLKDLGLEGLSGVKIIAIQRKFSHPFVPTPEAMLKLHDTIYLHTSDDHLKQIETIVAVGPALVEIGEV
ncbi:MAG: cation:proton antiporter [Proteobacteria bacterium]|nr:cation:proton antiporter [Pseudomonadota bacterium]